MSCDVKSYCKRSRNCTSIKSTYGSSSVSLFSSCFLPQFVRAFAIVLYCMYSQYLTLKESRKVPDRQQTTHAMQKTPLRRNNNATTHGPARVFALALLSVYTPQCCPLSVCPPLYLYLYPVQLLLARKEKTMRLLSPSEQS